MANKNDDKHLYISSLEEGKSINMDFEKNNKLL